VRVALADPAVGERAHAGHVAPLAVLAAADAAPANLLLVGDVRVRAPAPAPPPVLRRDARAKRVAAEPGALEPAGVLERAPEAPLLLDLVERHPPQAVHEAEAADARAAGRAAAAARRARKEELLAVVLQVRVGDGARELVRREGGAQARQGRVDVRRERGRERVGERGRLLGEEGAQAGKGGVEGRRARRAAARGRG